MSEICAKHLNQFFQKHKVKAQEISFLCNALDFPDFVLKTYPRNMFSSIEELIASSEDTSKTIDKKKSRITFSTVAEFKKANVENSGIYPQRCLLFNWVLTLDCLSLLLMYEELLLVYEKALKNNLPRESLNKDYKAVLIIICGTIDTILYYSYFNILKDKIKPKVKSVPSLPAVIDQLLRNLCFLEELLPVTSGQSAIVLKSKKKIFSFLKLVVEAGSEPMETYFANSITIMIYEKNRHHDTGARTCLSLNNIAFLDLKYKRLLKEFEEYCEKPQGNKVS